MNLLFYILKRLLYAFWVIVGVTLMVFVIFHVAMPDPSASLLGKYATADTMAALRHKLGLDRPWYMQYKEILQSAFTFNFGYSWHSKQEIFKILRKGAWVSLTLELPAFLLGNGLVIGVALWMTQYRGSIWDRLLVVFCIVMNSISFLVYILVGQFFLAYKCGFFDITGYEYGFPACLPYIILPTIITLLYIFCYEYRFYRTIMLNEVYQDYVRTARAKGLSEQVVLYKHVLKNVMVPIITTFVKEIPPLMFGSVLIESFFSMPGLGNVVLNAIHCSDFPTIKAAAVVAAVFSVCCTVIGDILYTIADPRMKL